MINGYLHPRFWAVARVLEQQLRRARRGGAAVCVYHRGEKVVDVWAGTRDTRGRPWQADTASLAFSTTKGVVATALHVLADRGLLDYDQPVSRYWPEFTEGGKEQITVRQLLCHEAGLYAIRSRIDHAERMLDWRYMCESLEESIPTLKPGSANAYHAFTFGWLVGELIQRVTGRPLAEVIEQELVRPLELDGVFVGAPRAERHRVAELIRPARVARPPEAPRRFVRFAQRIGRALRLPLDPGRMIEALVPKGITELIFSERVHDAPIPALNGVFTARSLARLYAALSGGGTLDGVRILSRETLARATEVQNRRMDLVVPFPMRWRLGYHLAATTRGILPHGFGHFGYGGSGAWADPERDLAVAMVVNRVAGTPLGDLRMLRLGAAAIRCADSRAA